MYTRGPWKYERHNNTTQVCNFALVEKGKSLPIAYVAYSTDAHLIAAAPDMYEALRFFVSEALSKLDMSKAIEKANAAIQKAEGKP